MKNTIKVTKRHIKEGDPESLDDCALCHAFAEAGYMGSLEIDLDTIIIGGAMFRCPPKLATFQQRGLDKKPQKPLTFKVSELKPMGISTDLL